MTADKLVILVTGAVSTGKTHFLEQLHKATAASWRTCGFFARGDSRQFQARVPAASYRLVTIGNPFPLPWAQRRALGTGFDFCEATRVEVTQLVRAELESDAADICFLDEIARLELADMGFSGLFRFALDSKCRIVVAAVKKSVLAEVASHFGVAAPLVIDLDNVSFSEGLRLAKRRIAGSDAERIGAFSGIGGAVEVGLGSVLHAYQVPFKGHFLAYLQNLLLIAFGKNLRGRGLVRISLLSAMLKAFSPMGNRFAPMAYIFLQGVIFAAPIRFLGWRLGSVLLGSLLMAWLTLGISLAMDYFMFGLSIFDAYAGAIKAVGGWLGAQSPSLGAVIGAVFAFKAVLAILLGMGAYLGDPQPFVQRLSRRLVRRELPTLAAQSQDGQRCTRGGTAVAALRDLIRPRFLVAFMVSTLLLLFFTSLSQGDVLTLVARGLCIAYLGFIVMRRVDLRAVGNWLDRRTGLGIGESLPVALEALGRPKHQDARAAEAPAAASEAEPASPAPARMT